MNLLKETVGRMMEYGKSPEDVLFVMDRDSWCSWEEFVKNADFEYNDGYGGHEIELELKVVGKDWWLERGEYDGSEWWEFKTMPTQPITNKLPKIRHE